MSSSSNTKNRPEVKFVKSEAPKIHHGFSGAVEYDERSQIFVPRARVLRWEQMKMQMERDAGDLQTALKEYQRTCPNDQDRAMNLDKTTWADVFKQMEDAQVANDERYEKGFMRLWRKFRDNVTVRMEDIDPWLDLIPADYGLCVVRAGIVLVLRAARRNAEDHKKVREAMVQIVQTVADARPKSNIFGQNSTLDTAVRDLYVAVLGAVSFVIRYLRDRNEKSRRSRMEDKLLSPWKQSDTKSLDLNEVEHAVQNVRIRAKHFERLYDNLKDQLQRASYEMQFDSYGRMLQVEAQMHSSNKQLSDVSERLEKIENFERESLEAKRRQNDLLEQVLGMNPGKREVQALNGLFQFLVEDQGATRSQVFGSRNELLAPEEHALIRPRTPNAARPTFLITIDELRQVLRIPFQMANDDLQEVIMSKSWLTDGAAAQTLLNYTNFQDWLIGASSQVLLIDGADSDHYHGTVSAMSILAIDIMTSLMKSNRQGQVAVIHFFCGLHSQPTEGPKMMTRSLIFQIMVILQRYRCLNLEFINSQDFMADLQSHNFDALLYTLQQLYRQLPQYLTVYCFIDGIDFYQSRSYLIPFHDDMVAFLRGITHSLLASGTAAPGFVDYYGGNGSRFNLKVLFTTAAGTLFDQFITNRITLSESDVHSGFPGEGVVEDNF